MAVDPTIDPDIDIVRILRPRSVFRMLFNLFHLRNQRLQAVDRGETIMEVVEVLSESGHGGQVISHSPDGDRWSVSIPAWYRFSSVETALEVQ